MIGLDTGFFLELLRGNKVAISVWKAAVNDEEELLVSCLTLFEITRLGLKGAVKDWQAIAETIDDVVDVIWLDREITSQAAHLSHGTGLPAIDALILASLLSKDVHEIYTTDSDFERYHSQQITIVNLRNEV